MAGQQGTHENQNGKRLNRGRFVTVCILIAVILVVALNVFCIFCACCPGVISGWLGGPEVIEPEAIQKAAEGGLEAAMIANGLSLIGIAISVWAALNITNALERKEIDGLYDEMDALQEKNEKKLTEFTSIQENAFQKLKQEYQENTAAFKNLQTDANNLKDTQKASLEKIHHELSAQQRSRQISGYNQLLLELLKSKQDLATDVIYQTLFDLKEKDLYDLPFDYLIRLEQYFGQVYQLHEYGRKELLPKVAQEGIEWGSMCFDSNCENEKIAQYVSFRIGELGSYRLSCRGADVEKELRFAVANYREGIGFFDAHLPEFDPEFRYPQSACVLCEKDRDISAYICNTLGHMYSNALLYGDLDDAQRRDYQQRSEFYCAHAVVWSRHKKERYLRNLACALERGHRLWDVEEEMQPHVAALYQQCMDLAIQNKYIPRNTLYTWLSFNHKHADWVIQKIQSQADGFWLDKPVPLKPYGLPEGSLRARHYANLARELYGGDLVFRKFHAFLLRDCCLWAILNKQDYAEANSWFDELEKELEALKAFYPDEEQWDDFMHELDGCVCVLDMALNRK